MIPAQPAVPFRAALARLLRLIPAAALALLPACSNTSDPQRDPGPLRIVTSIPPLAGLARDLVPEGAKVQPLIPQGRSEHGYELTPSNIESLASADIVILVGLNLEPRIEKFLSDHPSKHREVVRFSDVVGLTQPAAAHQADHAEHQGDHDHGPIDPHLWLDPTLVERLVPALSAAIEASLKDQDKLTDAERTRLAGDEKDLLERLHEFDTSTDRLLTPLAGRSIITHHNAWSRLADRYDLKIAAVIRPIETQEPTPAQVAAAVAAVRAQDGGHPRAIFVEPQFNPAVAERIAKEAGVKLGTLDPMGDEDWFALMRRNVESLATTLGD